MGCDIQLVTERGEIEDEVGDQENLVLRLVHADTSTDLIRCIDPYGDTVFNCLQMPKFLVEWSLVEAYATTPEEKTLVHGVRRLAERCAKGHHEYLKFVGD